MEGAYIPSIIYFLLGSGVIKWYVLYIMICRNGGMEGMEGKKGFLGSSWEMKNENELISFLKILQQLFLGFYPPSLHYCIFPSIYKNREYCTLYTFLTL